MSVMSSLKRKVRRHLLGFNPETYSHFKQAADLQRAIGDKADPMRHRAFAKRVEAALNMERQ